MLVEVIVSLIGEHPSNDSKEDGAEAIDFLRQQSVWESEMKHMGHQEG
ncbi:MAG: hypothetical protein IIB15_02575 [Chloroflexi bacterium]|nr:hypothetical protein [Chloroflexota bacterium]